MFARRLQVSYRVEGQTRPVPLAWLDSFAMRSFTNDAVFDDLLPIADGMMEAGYRVPLDGLEAALTAWFRRKRRLGPEACVRVEETSPANGQGNELLPRGAS